MARDQEMNVQLGRFIKDEREQLGVTVAQLAEDINENSVSIRGFESGVRPLSRYQLARLLDSLERFEIAQIAFGIDWNGERR